MSHPVALSQCRRWLAAHPEFEVVNFYDTAGSVKHLMAEGLTMRRGSLRSWRRGSMGPRCWWRGSRTTRRTSRGFTAGAGAGCREENGRGTGSGRANKASLAFSVEHRPGTLVRALEEFARAGVNLTKIESRPVPGMPWEYVFLSICGLNRRRRSTARFGPARAHCQMVKELGRYVRLKLLAR
jgi:prephenate dehydratase